MEPTVEKLKELFEYCPKEGTVIRRITVGSAKKGSVVNSLNSKGYLRVGIDNRRHSLHRVIWALAYGYWPKNEIDHINGIKTDNKLENLREVTGAENQRNRKTGVNNTSGCVGVTWHKKAGVWQAQIKTPEKYIYLGSFSDLDDAIAARKDAEKKYGFHENHGKR